MSAKDMDESLGIVRPEIIEEPDVELMEDIEQFQEESDLETDLSVLSRNELLAMDDVEIEVQKYVELETKEDAEIKSAVDTHVERTSELTGILTEAFKNEVDATGALPGAHQLQALSKVLDSTNNAIKLKNSINEAVKNRHLKDTIDRRKSKKPNVPKNVTIANTVNNIPSRTDLIKSGVKNITRAKQKVVKAQEEIIEAEVLDDGEEKQ